MINFNDVIEITRSSILYGHLYYVINKFGLDIHLNSMKYLFYNPNSESSDNKGLIEKYADQLLVVLRHIFQTIFDILKFIFDAIFWLIDKFIYFLIAGFLIYIGYMIYKKKRNNEKIFTKFK